MTELEEYDQKLIDGFMEKFMSAKPVSLTGDEAWQLYLKLKELKESKERCNKLLKLIDELTSKSTEVRRRAGLKRG